VLHELAAEQTWPNFKHEVSAFQGTKGSAYTSALHSLWAVMKKLQDSRADAHHDSSKIDTAYWDGITLAKTVQGITVRFELADAARAYQWSKVCKILEKYPQLSNACRPEGHSLYAPLHQVAHAGANKEIAESLIRLGAFRTLRNAAGQRPVDIAREKGHVHLLETLEPVPNHRVSEAALLLMQEHFHRLIRQIAGELVQEHRLRLPELEPLIEYDERQFWFEVPGMYGGFNYWLAKDGLKPRIGVQSWSRVIDGSGLHHDISEDGIVLLDRGFV
jgi:hypothetical protein